MCQLTYNSHGIQKSQYYFIIILIFVGLGYIEKIYLNITFLHNILFKKKGKTDPNILKIGRGGFLLELLFFNIRFTLLDHPAQFPCRYAVSLSLVPNRRLGTDKERKNTGESLLSLLYLSQDQRPWEPYRYGNNNSIGSCIVWENYKKAWFNICFVNPFEVSVLMISNKSYCTIVRNLRLPYNALKNPAHAPTARGRQGNRTIIVPALNIYSIYLISNIMKKGRIVAIMEINQFNLSSSQPKDIPSQRAVPIA